MPFIDLDALLPKTLEYFYDDCHFTEKGSERVAEVLSEKIIGGNFLETHSVPHRQSRKVASEGYS